MHLSPMMSFAPFRPRPRSHWKKLTQLFHPLGSTQNLTETVLIHDNCHQNGNIFVFSAPVAAQVDAVHVDIWIPSALQGAVAPVLDVDVGFLVQITDGGGGNLAALESLRDVLHTVHGYAGQVPFDERLFHAAFAAAVSLDDGGLRRDALELGHMERDIAGGRGEVAAVVTASVALACLAALVARRLGHLLRLGLQQAVERLLHSASDQLLDVSVKF